MEGSGDLTLESAAQAALKFFSDIYADAQLRNVLLEEVVPRDDRWFVTFGFDRGRQPSLSLAGGDTVVRAYKTIVLNRQGEPLLMQDAGS